MDGMSTGQFQRQRRSLLRAMLGAAAALALPAQANELRIGQPAPPLVLTTLDGKKIATRDLQGQVVIVTFWASYCEPCRDELPLLSAYAEANAARGLRVLGFALDGPELLGDVKKIAASLSFPVGLLGNPWAGGYGRIWRMPVSFVIARDGKLAYDGWLDKQPAWTAESLRRIVDPLLAT
jgi:cytochrome c biogenesis protein CcmG/thiol:disulfide interchange protein DsbE